MSGWQEVFLFAIFGFVVSWAGAYLINLIRTPSAIYHDQLTEISNLQPLVKAFTEKPKRSAPEEHNYRLAKDALTKLPDKAGEVLRHLDRFESVTFGHFTPALPSGKTRQEYAIICREAEKLGLIKVE